MRTLRLAVAAVLIATSAYAQAPNEETVTIRAAGVPIGTLLTELAERYRFEKPRIQREVEQHPVSVVLEQVPLQVALRRILQASGLDFAISGRRVIIGDWTTTARQAADGSADPRAAALQAEEQAAIRAAEAAAEQQAISDAAGDESTIVRVNPVAFVANGENITYLEPNFVPYKLRPEVRALRMAIDVTKIP
jgi:hypothetical protein